jgi:hypothetical protein
VGGGGAALGGRGLLFSPGPPPPPPPPFPCVSGFLSKRDEPNGRWWLSAASGLIRRAGPVVAASTPRGIYDPFRHEDHTSVPIRDDANIG